MTSGTQSVISEVIGGVVALSLILAAYLLLRDGQAANGFTDVVPIIVAFYFGGRTATSAANTAIRAANGSLAGPDSKRKPHAPAPEGT